MKMPRSQFQIPNSRNGRAMGYLENHGRLSVSFFHVLVLSGEAYGEITSAENEFLFLQPK